MVDRLRASNADRQHAAALLRAHFVAGRLTHDELDDRLAATLGAATFGDLRRALADLPGAGQALQRDSRLERSYRRLLALYPARYRRVHEEEMLAVLMTTAADGQGRPGLAETADLIIGALRIRSQTVSRSLPGWRGALALISAGPSWACSRASPSPLRTRRCRLLSRMSDWPRRVVLPQRTSSRPSPAATRSWPAPRGQYSQPCRCKPCKATSTLASCPTARW